MRHLFFFYSLLFVSVVLSEGFVAGTKIKTEYGYRNIENIYSGSKVCAYNCKKRKQRISKVSQTYCSRIPFFIRLFFSNQTVDVAPDQRFYIFGSKDWIFAVELVGNSYLKKELARQTGLLHVAIVHEPRDVYIFTTKKYHTFYATNSDIVTHNFDLSFASALPISSQIVPFAADGVLTTIQSGHPLLILGMLALGAGYYVYNWFASKHKEKKEAKHLRRKLEIERQRMLEEEKRNGVFGGGGPNKWPKKKKDEEKKDIYDRKTEIQKGRVEAKRIAKENGWEEEKGVQFGYHGETVYKYDKQKNLLVCYDNTRHKGGFWKMFKGRERLGTFDKTLKIIIGD